MTGWTMIAKPPPPPPSHRSAAPVRVPAPMPTKQLTHYPVPMDGNKPAWANILKAAGYPTDVLVLDFETYFDGEYGMPGLTTVEYVMDKRFEVLGLAHLRVVENFPDYEHTTCMTVGEAAVAGYLKYAQGEYGEDLGAVTVVAQNANFDATVLAQRYGIHPKYLIDTLALARAWNARARNDLDSLAKRWNLPPKGDTMEFSGVTFKRRFHKPRGKRGQAGPPIQRPIATDAQVVALAAYARNDVMREWEIFTLLLPRLSNPSFELRVMRHTTELFTRPVLWADLALGDSLVVGMTREVATSCLNAGHTQDELSGNISFESLLTTALEACGDQPGKYWKPCKTGMKLAEAKADPERVLLLEHFNETVRNLMAARTAIKSWPLHSERVKRIMRMALALDGAMPVPLKYWGAHTGRWSGGEKINLQNLAKQGHDLIVAIRGLLIAALGHKLVIVDAAAIEARVLAWIAGQWDLVTKFANREEIYCGFATQVLGWPVRKARKDDLPPIAKRLTWARNAVGKIGVLGCGYGMGAKEPGTQDQPNYLFKAAGLDFGMAQKIVATYRATNTGITQFWNDLERAFIYVAEYHRPVAMPRGLALYSLPDVDVIIRLPNGRELKYHKVKVTQEHRGKRASVYNDTEHSWEFLWGGTLTENVVQAMSRDVLIEAGMRMEARGHHVAHHVHDELILHVPEAEAPAVLDLTIKELSVTPAWAPRMPLSAEGVISERYGKH